MAGDPEAARHLGYYGELRAAMSVLASQGIGVFGNEHIIVKGTQTCDVLKGFGGTHQFVWDALEVWAASGAAHKAIFHSIQPGGLPLWDWLNQFSVGSRFVAAEWLCQWGLDLSRLADDRDARNLASYRPTAFTTPGPRPIRDTMKGILQLWEVCDPGASGGFPVLDRHLLRRGLELVSRTHRIPGRSLVYVKRLYDQNLTKMLDGVSPTSSPGEGWGEFLSYQNLGNSPKILSDANGKSDAYHSNHSKQVLARATLLLRVATGCSAKLLGEVAPHVQAELNFWTSNPSVRRRLWPQSTPSFSSIDLWSDVEDASSSIGQWLSQRGLSACRHALWVEQAPAAVTLATPERAFLWGVGL